MLAQADVAQNTLHQPLRVKHPSVASPRARGTNIKKRIYKILYAKARRFNGGRMWNKKGIAT